MINLQKELGPTYYGYVDVYIYQLPVILLLVLLNRVYCTIAGERKIRGTAFERNNDFSGHRNKWRVFTRYYK